MYHWFLSFNVPLVLIIGLIPFLWNIFYYTSSCWWTTSVRFLHCWSVCTHVIYRVRPFQLWQDRQVACLNPAHGVSHIWAGLKEEGNFLCSNSTHCETPQGSDQSPHRGTPASESHAQSSLTWLWRPCIMMLLERSYPVLRNHQARWLDLGRIIYMLL